MISRLHISALHRNLVRWSGQSGKMVMVDDGNGMEKISKETNEGKCYDSIYSYYTQIHWTALFFSHQSPTCCCTIYNLILSTHVLYDIHLRATTTTTTTSIRGVQIPIGLPSSTTTLLVT